jgi:hypothetical protein
MARFDRAVALNIVLLPMARSRRAMLRALESRADERGATQCTLISTETAHRFYVASGYVDDGPPIGAYGTDAGYPMSKPLANSPHRTA